MKNPHNSKETQEEYTAVHTPRWTETIAWIKAIKGFPEYPKVLEISNRSQLAEMVVEEFGGKVDNTNFDVRKEAEWKRMRKKYDLVLNCEVIEHLPDCDNPHGEFDAKGVKTCLEGCARALDKGGHLLLTTPNASSTVVLDRWIQGWDPANWAPHPRELGYSTVRELVKQAGFEIVRSETPEVYDHKKTPEMLERRAWLNEKMTLLGAPVDFRGETTFILAKKKG